MTQREWHEVLDWMQTEFWPEYKVPPGRAEAIWRHLRFFPPEKVKFAIEEFAQTHVDDRFPRSLWSAVIGRCRRGQEGAGAEEPNEHGHTPTFIRNMCRRCREACPSVKDSGESDDLIYQRWLVEIGAIRGRYGYHRIGSSCPWPRGKGNPPPERGLPWNKTLEASMEVVQAEP